MKKIILTSLSILLLGVMLSNISCEKLEVKRITKLNTGEVLDITHNFANVQGLIIDVSDDVQEIGHCWDTLSNPDINSSKEISTGTYSKGAGIQTAMTNLLAGYTYYVRAYAITSKGQVYGEEISFTTSGQSLITITSPNSTSSWALGSTQQIAWTGSIVGGVRIELRQGGNLAELISESAASDTSFPWEIPTTLAAGNYFIQISSVQSGEIVGVSEAFEITSDLFISVTAPTTDDNWQKGSTKTITWDDNIDGDVKITLFMNSTIHSDLITNTESDGIYDWGIPNDVSITAGTNYSINISSIANPSLNNTGNQFEISEATGGVTDYDGITYSTVTIGTQVWMAENFKGTQGKAGALISYAYDNNASNVTTYGRLYSWDQAMLGAPAGWHLPTDEEWKQLEMYLGMSQVDVEKIGTRGAQGGLLKATGYDLWNAPNEGATNVTGFTALPGGNYSSSGATYGSMGTFGFFWSSSENSSVEAWYRRLNDYSSGVTRNYINKGDRFSVRYIKDSDKTVQDIDGNIYDVVVIGVQQWMKQNLKVTKYSTGTAIPLVTDNTAWGNLPDDNTVGAKAYCYYNNSDDNAAIYGALYTYAAATNGDNSGSNVQGVCPTGWHLPSDAEWTTLTTFLGGESVAGGKMKATGIDYWNSPNDATNSSEFTGLPGGFRYDVGSFLAIGNYSDWWSATETSASLAIYRTLSYDNTVVTSDNSGKSYGFSVRCIKD